MKKVIVYTKDYCGYCRQAKSLLDRKGIRYEEVDLGQYPELVSEIQKRTGQRTVPQIFIGEQSIGGFDRLSALEKSGELDRLLADPT